MALSASGLPAGVTAKFVPAGIAAPGTGASILTSPAASAVTGGAYIVTVTATGGGVTKTQPLTLTVIPPSFTLAVNLTGPASLTPNSWFKGAVATVATNGFKSAIALSATGMPAGVTGQLFAGERFDPGHRQQHAHLDGGPGAGPRRLQHHRHSHGRRGDETRRFRPDGLGAQLHLTLGGAAVVSNRGGSLPITVSTATTGSISTPPSRYRSAGCPRERRGSSRPAGIPAPGSGSSYLTLAATTAAKPGTFNLTVTAAGGGQTKTQPLTLAIK